MMSFWMSLTEMIRMMLITLKFDVAW
jgi:hypothetical protein